MSYLPAEENLADKIHLPASTDDIPPLLLPGVTFDLGEAIERVLREMIALVPREAMERQAQEKSARAPSTRCSGISKNCSPERPDELVQRVELPQIWQTAPTFKEYYGSVPRSMRAIDSSYVGWFDGNATNLFPLSEEDRARGLIDRIGGADRVLSHARDALAGGEFRWTAELAELVLAVDGANVERRGSKPGR